MFNIKHKTLKTIMQCCLVHFQIIRNYNLYLTKVFDLFLHFIFSPNELELHPTKVKNTNKLWT